MPITRKHLAWGAAAAAFAGLLFVWLAPEPVPVETALATRGPIRVTVDEEGEIRAHDRYVVAAPVSGRLLRVELLDGDPVKEGEVVARIAPLPLTTREREELVAKVAAARAAFHEADARAVHARSDYEQARRERARAEQLVQKNFLSPQMAEQARVAETTGADELSAARQRVSAAQAEVRAAEAGLLGADAGNLVEIRSPVSGQVLRVQEKSERVVAGGAPLLAIGDPRRFEVVMDVLSTEAVKVRPGMAMALDQWGGPGQLKARVRTVEPGAFTKISALGVEEQRVNIVADLLDPPGPLGDGYRVEGRVTVAEKADALKVPTSSLFRAGDRWELFVVDGNRARKRTVETGLRNPAETEILQGLEAGATVVRHPPNALADGMRIVAR